MNILSRIKTIEEYARFKNELNKLILELSGSTALRVEEIAGKYPNDFVEILMQELSENGKFDTKSVHSHLLSLYKSFENIKIFELTLAIPASEDTINKIYNWTLANIADNLVLKINRNSALVGGVLLSYNGHYLDLSLRKKLDAVLPTYKLGTK